MSEPQLLFSSTRGVFIGERSVISGFVIKPGRSYDLKQLYRDSDGRIWIRISNYLGSVSCPYASAEVFLKNWAI